MSTLLHSHEVRLSASNARWAHPIFLGSGRAECRWLKAGANPLIAVECRIESSRWADFLEWRACLAASWPKKRGLLLDCAKNSLR